jgi:hypothetical protein
MIYPILKFLTEQLNTYIDQVKKPGDNFDSPVAILQNISQLDEAALKTTNKIMISLVNISEETAMKNNPDYMTLKNETVMYGNPPLKLNLYIIIAPVMVSYENELIYLTHVMNFFQGKNTFNRKNSVSEVDGLTDDFHLILDICSLGFEQLNYIWSTLGGKQHPFACYKVRTLMVERDSLRETRGIIREVRIDDRKP